MLGGGVVAGCSRAPSDGVATPGNVKPPQESSVRKLSDIGLQLSTVTALMLQDFEGTLTRVAEIGYSQVEFSAMGFLGRPVGMVKTLLGELGLKAPVARLSPVLPDNFLGLSRDGQIATYRARGGMQHLMENVAASLEAAVELQQKTLIIPAIMPDQFTSLDQVKANLQLLNQAAGLCSQAGVQLGYHNHNWELAPLDGVVPYDLMLAETDPDKFTFQFDVYWITKGGADIYQYLAQHPGRFSSIHMKDIDEQGDFADVGDGLIDFPKLTKVAQDQGARYFFVERDNPPAPEDSIMRSYAYLQAMRY